MRTSEPNVLSALGIPWDRRRDSAAAVKTPRQQIHTDLLLPIPKPQLPHHRTKLKMSHPSPDQALLKRHPSLSPSAFKEYYIHHHGPLALPYFLDCGVTYYAQIHNIRWASPEAEQAHPHIRLSDWDAAAECVFGAMGPPRAGNDSPVAERYDERFVLPDERRFLVSEAKEHLRVVEAGSFVGERVEFVVGGEVVVGEGEMEGVWERWREVEREVREEGEGGKG